MSVVAIAPMHNSPGKKDATGAFIPEAKAFAKMHHGRLMLFDSHAPPRSRFVDVIDYLTPMRNVEAVGFFCHGFKSGLQIGVSMRTVHVLAATLRTCGVRTVALYACDTARDGDGDRSDDVQPGPGGDGGFASALSAAMPGVDVWGHAVAGHATRSPWMRRFRDGGDGEWAVEPKSALWAAWRRALQDDAALRLSFPLWPRERLVAELARRAAAA